MKLPFHFLKAHFPLTKEYLKKADGTIEKTSYPNVYEVTSLEENCTDLRQIATVLRKHAALGHCLIKGLLSRPLKDESRAGTTNPNAQTNWMLFDLDGVSYKSPDEFMKDIGYEHISYVVQYSASHHIANKLLRCHILVLLDTPTSAPLLKQHLIAWNFNTPTLKSMLTLTRTGTALRYGLDLTTCQSDKLIYIANPILTNIKDPLANTQRIAYIKKKSEFITLPPTPSLVVNKAEIEKRIAELRAIANLPARKNVFKQFKNTEILSKPDEAIISGIKEDRGFVYFNLNGGDSWAYYHPANNPDFVHNFKGEAVYLTKELLPEYWAQISVAQKSAAPPPLQANSQGLLQLAFLNKRSNGYWRGEYDQKKDHLDIYPAKNETILRHYAQSKNFAIGDFVPEWDVSFDPNDNVRVDTINQTVNLFQPTQYMLTSPKPARIKAIPPTIYKVIHHAVGSDDVCFWRFINWVAFIVQFRTMTRTAWILHGTEGTGKGVLFHKILAQIFGLTQTTIQNMGVLDSRFNDYIERMFIVFIDEIQTSSLRSENEVMGKLRNFITEPDIAIRAMYQTEYLARNYSNWVFSSNRPAPIAIPPDDRRFNVGKYQPNKLQITEQEIHEFIPLELQDFYQYLTEYSVNKIDAHTPLKNKDRDELIAINETSIDGVANALLKGNFDFFIESLPTTQIQENIDREIVDNYKATLIRIIDRTNPKTNHCNLSRDELRVLFQYNTGDMPLSPHKFTSRLKHHRILVKATRIDEKTVQGIAVTWHDTTNFVKHKTQLIGKPEIKLVPKVAQRKERHT